MTTKTYRPHTLVAACSLALLSMGASAADTRSNAGESTYSSSPSKTDRGEVNDAIKHVNAATEVVRRMEREPGMQAALQKAEGIFIVPKYAKAALGVGGRGGGGVLLVKRNGAWSDPAFFDIGGISVGVQAGVEAGAIAMLLNNQKAVNSFMQDNNWSLNADAGLTVAKWSAKAQGSAGKGDITLWSDTKGLLGALAVSVSDIHFDKDETTGYYGKQVALRDIIDGNVTSPAHSPASLKEALMMGNGPGGGYSGGTGSMSNSGSDLHKGMKNKSGSSYGK